MTNTLFAKSIKDFFTAPVLKLALLPFIITMVVMYALFFWLADAGLDSLQDTYVQIEQQEQSIAPDGTVHTQSESVELEGIESIIGFLLKHTLTSWLITFIVYSLGMFFVLLFSIVIALFIIGFLTPAALRIIQERHYPDVEMQGFGNIASMILFFVKTFVVMILLLLILMPLYFIPIVNVVAFNLPFYYLFHKMLTYDVASTICTKEEYKRIMYFQGTAIRMKTLLLFILSLVPFVALFGALFFVIYLGHIYFTETLNLRHQSDEKSDTQALPQGTH